MIIKYLIHRVFWLYFFDENLKGSTPAKNKFFNYVEMILLPGLRLDLI